MKYIVSEDTEIVLDGKKYLLEKGDIIVLEKWSGDAEIEHTGEHASKSVEQLRKEASSLKKRQEAHKKNNDGKADPEITEQLREVNFAIRAKTGWKKGEGATKR
jgi:hypothetical protein